MTNRSPKTLYYDHKSNANRRSIPFLLTFKQWWFIWQRSGYWSKRGKRRGQYVMARKGDKGAYEVGNVLIVTTEQNIRMTRYSAQERQRRRLVMIGNTLKLGKKESDVTRRRKSIAKRWRDSHALSIQT